MSIVDIFLLFWALPSLIVQLLLFRSHLWYSSYNLESLTVSNRKYQIFFSVFWIFGLAIFITAVLVHIPYSRLVDGLYKNRSLFKTK